MMELLVKETDTELQPLKKRAAYSEAP